MEIKTLKLTHIKATSVLEDYAYKKFLTLNKFLLNAGLPQDLYIEIGKSTTHHKGGRIFRAEAMLELSGRVLRAEAEENDLYAAIDAVHDELARQIKEFKGKLSSKQKKQALRAKESR